MATSSESREQLIVRLGTPIAEANAAAVASTITAVIAVLEESRKLIAPDDTLRIKARPFGTGSFEIILDLITFAAIFRQHPLVDRLLETFRRYVEFRKDVGEVAGSGTQLPVPASGPTDSVVMGDVINSVVVLIHNSDLSLTVDRAAADVQADETIKEVDVLKGPDREPVASISREELPRFRFHPGTPPLLSLPQKKKPRKAVVTIHTPVLRGKGRWTVLYKNRPIEVTIGDERFRERVDAGLEAFRAGDQLRVELLVVEEYSPEMRTYVDKSYTITKVRERINREENKELFTNDDDD